jgi:hypothetical protein
MFVWRVVALNWLGGNGGQVWKNFVTAPDTPAGFTLKTAHASGTNEAGSSVLVTASFHYTN